MNTHVPIRLGLALALVLTAGAASLPLPTSADPVKPAPACFWARNVDNFAAENDERTVNLRVGVHDVYQLTLFAPCQDIDWNQHIVLRSRGSDWICEGSNLDAEIDTHTSIGPQRCPVTSVRKLSPAEIAALPKDGRP
jgi:hypothetical protein